MMLDKICSPILKFLDNKTVFLVVCIVLILLLSTIFGNINHSIRMFTSNKLVRIVWVLLIVCISQKHMCLALLLGLLYVISIGGVSEFFENSEEKKDEPEMKSEEFKNTEKKEEKEKEEKKETNPEDMLSSVVDTITSPFKPKEKEDFIPFFMTNKDFEAGYDSSLKGSSKKGCLATDPNHFELVGDACKPVAVFEGELNAQGMNDITGFNMNNNMTAQPI